MQRRIFLMAGGSMLSYATPPADQTVLGLIGSGSRGTFVIGVFQKDPAVRVSAICDVYEPKLERAVTVAKKTSSVAPRPIATTKRYSRTVIFTPC